ncbi:MAG TPA: hypothetical protein PLQ40_12295, partial [Ferruginibacter sp.]|nr:hypothetical protein [Ferruginibacter sp.]
SKVKTPEELFSLYLKSVGRGANLLLNVPPDRRGLIHENDSAALVGFRRLVEKSFASNISRKGTGYFNPHNGARQVSGLNDGNPRTLETIVAPDRSSMGIEFADSQRINCVVLKEYLEKGQHTRSFRLLLMTKKHELLREIKGTSIGSKRILTFPTTNVGLIGLAIDDQQGYTAITEIQAYLIDEKLLER